MRVEGSRGQLALYGAGDTITLSADGLGSFLELLSSGPEGAWRGRILCEVHTRLDRAGLKLEMRVGRMRVVRIGRAGQLTRARIGLYLSSLLRRWPSRRVDG